MILPGLVGDLEGGAEECRSKLRNQFFEGVFLVPVPLAELPVAPV